MTGGDATLGTISTGGLYTAPSSLPDNVSFLTIRATSQADSTRFAEARATLASDVAVAISPAAASVMRGATQLFTAGVTGSGNPNRGVTWSVTGSGCAGDLCGTVTPAGLYTAPNVVPFPQNIRVQARSQADRSKTAEAATTVTSDLVVSIAPGSAGVELGATQAFLATVSGTNATNDVRWSLNGIGSNTTTPFGVVFSDGTYRAPAVLPSPATATLAAGSVLDPSKTASAGVTILSSFTLSVSGPSVVNTGATNAYTAVFQLPPGSQPLLDVTWSLAGPGCTGAACGTLVAVGAQALYTAPPLAPAPNRVTLTATSVADPAKVATLEVTINTQINVSVAPSPASVELDTTQQFTATVAGTTNQSVVWDVNGVVGGNPTVGTILQTGLYQAPVNMPAGRQVTVRATSQADPTKSGTSAVTLTSRITVLVSPSASTRAVTRRETFSAQVSNSANPSVSWRVNGVLWGNDTFGRICVAGAVPCFAPTGPTALAVDYQAPASVPSSNPVGVQAVSEADPNVAGSAVVTILANVQVQVTPAEVTLPLSTAQQPSQQLFSAAVVGTPNQGVTWSVSGTGCTDAACGTISSSGLYTAPTTAPSPANVTVRATSQDDPAQSGTATVTFGSGPTVTTLRPASITAGATFSTYTLRVIGFNFVSTASGPGSKVVFKGTARDADCPNTNECRLLLQDFEFRDPGSISVQIENPPANVGDPPVRSNEVSFVVVADAAADDVVSLTPGSPQAVGKDIVVVEPTSGPAGGAGGLAANINLIGAFVGASCNARGSSIGVTRPASGSSSVDICLGGDALSASYAYGITGPAANDISISNVRSLSAGLVGLTLSLSSATQPGLRTLYVTASGKEKAAATGAIEVK